MAEKKDKADVHYTPKAEKHGERCELCRVFIASAGQCRRVAGHINPKGWCQLWERG